MNITMGSIGIVDRADGRQNSRSNSAVKMFELLYVLNNTVVNTDRLYIKDILCRINEMLTTPFMKAFSRIMIDNSENCYW